MADVEDAIENIDIDGVSDITEIKRLYSLLQQKEVGLVYCFQNLPNNHNSSSHSSQLRSNEIRLNMLWLVQGMWS